MARVCAGLRGAGAVRRIGAERVDDQAVEVMDGVFERARALGIDDQTPLAVAAPGEPAPCLADRQGRLPCVGLVPRLSSIGGP